MNNYTPKVSLLIPIYNVEAYLHECLDSVKAQTFEDFEAICINDGSTDGSRTIIEEYLDDPRFKLIDKPNSGYGASMNQGLDAAVGEYIGILESDDFIDPNMLEIMVALGDETGADVVRSDFYLYWTDPEERNHKFGWVQPKHVGRRDPLEHNDVFFLQPSIWAALYRHNFLEKNQIRFLETPGASYQDTSFNFKVWASTNNVVLTDQAFLHYRQDNQSSSINAPDKMYCICDEYDEIMRFVEGHPHEKELRPIIASMRYDTYLWNYGRLTESLQSEWVQRMAEDFRREDANGDINYRMLAPWKVIDRKQIVKDPNEFHRQRLSGGRRGKVAAFKRYWQAGGLPLILRSIKIRFTHTWY